MKDELAGSTAVVAILRDSKIYCVSVQHFVRFWVRHLGCLGTDTLCARCFTVEGSEVCQLELLAVSFHNRLPSWPTLHSRYIAFQFCIVKFDCWNWLCTVHMATHYVQFTWPLTSFLLMLTSGQCWWLAGSLQCERECGAAVLWSQAKQWNGDETNHWGRRLGGVQ